MNRQNKVNTYLMEIVNKLIIVDRYKAVLLLWFLTVTCSCCPYLIFRSAIMLVIYFIKFQVAE